jgi:hypothetical protein
VRQGADTSDYQDPDLTFFLQVYRDHGLARACLTGLRRVFPAARVILVSDGDDDPRHAALAGRCGAEYVRGERLSAVRRGGQVVQRMLDLFLQRPSPWLFRIDTDTRVHRRFRWLPAGTCVFGTLEHETQAHHEPLDPPCVQGGCIGFTRSAVELLASSRVFASPALEDWAGTWATSRDARERARNGRVSFDHLVRWGYRELALPPRDFAEVRCVWRGRVPNPGLRYAVTHPHKRWWQVPRLYASLWLSRMRTTET